jgi:DNA-binding PadR family transcriptional regulator
MNETQSPLVGLGRITDVAILILSSLAGGEKHGYALVKDVEEFAGVRIAPGTLYEALARLESKGLIEALESDERRRPYRLSASGASALSETITSQQRIIKVAKTRLNKSWSTAPGAPHDWRDGIR